MKRKNIQIWLIIGLTFISSAGLYSQQVPHFTQYIFNSFIINPAIAGTHNYYQIRSDTRVQYVGIPDHPLTSTLSVYGPHKEMDMGWGGFVYTDNTGPTSRTGFSGSYAYNIALNETMRLSGGISLGFMQYKIDMSRIKFARDGNSAVEMGNYSKLVPDASIGLYLYSYNYHVGIATNQLLNSTVDVLESDTTKGINRLKSHFFLSGGYRYNIDKDWTLDPTIMLKAMYPVPLQMDLTVKGIYKGMVWGGLSYRTGDAVTILLGYIHEGQYSFGYSYDFVTSSIRTHSSGSHEIAIGYRFNEIK
jgi:type IX secretion system PorP/SprF family membrane protein